MLISLAIRRPGRGQHPSVAKTLDQSRQLVAVECIDRYTITHPQQQFQSLEPARRLVEDFARRLGRFTRRHQIDVAVGRAHVPPAAPRMVRVSGATEPTVVLLTPIQHVVAALVAQSGPVRDLGILETLGAEQIVGQFVFLGLIVVIGVPVRLRRKWCAGFDREPVRRHMGRFEGDDRANRVLPISQGLTRGAVDHIEVEGRQREQYESHRPLAPRCAGHVGVRGCRAHESPSTGHQR